MKRTRKGVLIQGTLELGDWPNLDHEILENNFLKLIAKDLNEIINPIEWPTTSICRGFHLLKLIHPFAGRGKERPPEIFASENQGQHIFHMPGLGEINQKAVHPPPCNPH